MAKKETYYIHRNPVGRITRLAKKDADGNLYLWKDKSWRQVEPTSRNIKDLTSDCETVDRKTFKNLMNKELEMIQKEKK